MRKRRFSIREMLLAALFTALIAAGAWIRIPIPPAPITLQTLFVILAGLLLGWRGGMISSLLYMLLGLIGLPVFTGGGGLSSVLMPTFGYIVGFPLGAALAGFLAGRAEKPSFWRYLLAGGAGTLVIYLFGVSWYGIIKALYFRESADAYTLFVSLFLIFLPGDLLKCAAAALAASRLSAILPRSITKVR